MNRAVGLVLWLWGAGAFAVGVRAFDDGRFADALAAFAEAEAAPFGSESPAVHFNQALAALQADAVTEAEIAAERFALCAGPDGYALRDFLLGSAAFARCLSAERQASGAEAEPFAFDLAIGAAQRAAQAWQSAAMRHNDWPAARRNVERALLKLADLTRRRQQAAQQQRKQRDPRADEPPPPPPEVDVQPGPSRAAQSPLVADDVVQRLLDRLAIKEREKRELRHARRQVAGSEVEQDW